MTYTPFQTCPPEQGGGALSPRVGLLLSPGSALTVTKEGVFLRNVSPSLGLSDHFPGCGILNYRSDRDWSLRAYYFWSAL